MEKEMDFFEAEFAKAMSGETMPMDQVLRYVADARGKRLRPKLVFLSAKLFGEVNDATRRTALFVELIHTATLIHDDVVDGSYTRRGQASVNGHWDNKTAVLAGDYLLSKAIQVLSDPADHQILMEMLDTALAMSEGELMQNAAIHNYLEIITRKTARLIKSCCVGGAMSVMDEKTEDGRRKTELISEFGLNLGLVFQMRDDILDNDDPETTALAEKLLPRYFDKAMKSLSILEPMVEKGPILDELKALTVFCAERVV